jgi:hypothetical protein
MIRLLAFVALCAAGCGNPPNFLDGSVKTAHPLDFDSEQLRFFTDQKTYDLEYHKTLDPNNPSAPPATPVKIVYNQPTGGVVKDKKIDLTDPKEAAVVQRIMPDSGDIFPATLKVGSVTWHTPATVNTVTTGEFAVQFDNGETLSGTWQTKLTSASFGN